MISTEIPISFRTKIVLCHAVPRRINASTPVEKGIETAPTKRSVTARLAIMNIRVFLLLSYFLDC